MKAIERLKIALKDCVFYGNNGTFPEKQCAMNRARVLLEELSQIGHKKIRKDIKCM